MKFWIAKEEDFLKCSRLEIGGKGFGLVQLKKQGLNVPPFGVISTEGVKRKVWHTDEETHNAIMTWCKSILCKSPVIKIAVRSSACEEDQYSYSFAGKFLTEVLANPIELIQTLDRIAENYETEMKVERENIPPSSQGLAVILQEFISGMISGVCFSVEPIQAHPQQAYCEIVHGENKPLVDGNKQPTRVYFDPSNGEMIHAQVGEHGPTSLPDGLLAELSHGLLTMEWGYHTAVDMEWTWDGEKLWFLQVRPITAVTPAQNQYPKECMTCWFFDQRFIEPITPITQTTLIPLILRKAISEGLGMRRRTTLIEAYYFGGQVYLPHRVYFDLLDGCPRWWLSADLKQLFPQKCYCSRQKQEWLGFRFWLDSFFALIKNYKDGILVLRRWKQWKTKAENYLENFNKVEIKKLSLNEWRLLWEELQKYSEEFLEIHRWAVLWSSYVYRLCAKYLLKWFEKQQIENVSITHQGNDVLNEYLQTGNEELLPVLIEQYGHRCTNLDYISKRWEEIYSNEEFHHQNKIAISNTVHTKINKHFGIMGKIGNLLLKVPLKYIHLREEQRFIWEKFLYVQKKLLEEAGSRLASANLADNMNDVWFVTWDELCNSLFHNKRLDKIAINLRKHQWCVEHVFPKPMFIGPREDFLQQGAYNTIKPENIWEGWSVSSGTIEGTVFVSTHGEELIPNIPRPRILIAPCLNPGQTWCLPLWDGVILEKGSELSHPSILAREYKVPMIVGIPDITKKLKIGDNVLMNGSTGLVQKIEPKQMERNI